MRDHTKLRAFELADQAAVAIYKATKSFPRDEIFGLTSQLRRAAVSVASNIVEGCARSSMADYLRFLDMAYGSACELRYQFTLAERLGYVNAADVADVSRLCLESVKVLNALIRSYHKT